MRSVVAMFVGRVSPTVLVLAGVAPSPAMKEQTMDFGAMMQPVPLTAKFSEPGYNVWCGSAVRGEDGQYHLFYSRWPLELGHHAWVTHSEVARAVADNPFGPYRPAGVALPARGKDHWDGLCTHNPTIHKFDGKYYLYYMGNTGDGRAMRSLNWIHRNNQRIGVAVADAPEGPWTRFDAPLIETTPGFHDALCNNNPSIARRPDGSFLMVYKAINDKAALPFGGPVVHVVAISDQPTGPFRKLPDPVFTVAGEHFAAEDPFIWRGPDRYWAIVKDMRGVFTRAGESLALFESHDGVRWKLAAHPLVTARRIRWADGTEQVLSKLERPQVLLDERGRPIALFCAAADEASLNNSFNLHIPLKAD